MKKLISRLSFLFLAVLLLCFMMIPVFAAEGTGADAPVSYESGPVIVMQPNDQFVFVLSYAHFSVKAYGDGLTYKWEYRKDPSNKYWTNVAGATESTLSIEGKAYREGYQYRCTITDVHGNVAYSNIATIHVYEQNDLSTVATQDILSNVFTDIWGVLPVALLALLFFVGVSKAIQFISGILRKS